MEDEALSVVTLRCLLGLLALCSLVARADAQESRFTSLPGVLPASQPASQPTSRPASQPASQPTPTSQPAEPFRDRPINLLVYRHKKYRF